METWKKILIAVGVFALSFLIGLILVIRKPASKGVGDFDHQDFLRILTIIQQDFEEEIHYMSSETELIDNGQSVFYTVTYFAASAESEDVWEYMFYKFVEVEGTYKPGDIVLMLKVLAPNITRDELFPNDF